MREGNGAGREAADFNFNSKAQRRYGKNCEGGKIMARKKVEGGGRISLSKQTIGTEWSGIYVKGYEIDSSISPTGKQQIWQFMDDEGVPFEFYGCASMNVKMKQVPLQSTVWIKVAGTYKSRFGKDAANIEIDYDDEVPA